MRRLNLDTCSISIDHFVPNVIMDRNLYDDIMIESGTLSCDIRVDDDTDICLSNALTKFIMLLEAFNDGYVKAIGGWEYGLRNVFCVIGEPIIIYIGAGTATIKVNIASMVYNPYMHMSLLKDAIAAGEGMLLPNARNYFDISMNDYIDDNEREDQTVKAMETQINAFRETIIGNMLSV